MADQDDLRLSEWTIAPPPPGLVDRVLARVADDAQAQARAGDPDPQPAVAPIEPPSPASRDTRRTPRRAMVVGIAAGAVALAAAAAVVLQTRDAVRPGDTGDTGDLAAPAGGRPSVVTGLAPGQPFRHHVWDPPASLVPTSPARLLAGQDERDALRGAIADAFARRWSAITRTELELPERGPIWGNRRDVEKVVGLAAPFLDPCFDRASAAARAAGGAVTVVMIVNTEPDAGTQIASVRELEQDGGVLAGDPELRDCIVRTLVQLHLPPTPIGQERPGGYEIRHTFEFVRGPDDAQPHAKASPSVVFDPPPTGQEIAILAERAFLDGRYDEANRLANAANEIDPENTLAYEIAGRAGCRRAAATGATSAPAPYHYARMLQGDAAARVIAECAAVRVTKDGAADRAAGGAVGPRVIYDGGIPVAGRGYKHYDDDANEVDIPGLDARVSDARVLRFTLEYPFKHRYEGKVAVDGGAALRQIIDAIREGYRAMYRRARAEASHEMEDLVIETIELDDATGTLEITIGS
jgi:hypothetical protein